MTARTGRCLCGAVSFSASESQDNVHACHCGMCRRWSGGPFLGISCGQDVVFEGAEHITVFSSSAWAERGFCQCCGSHLFYRLKGTNQHEMPVGVFDGAGSFIFDLQIFIDHKPDFYSFANPTKLMTEQELIEKYSPDQQ